MLLPDKCCFTSPVNNARTYFAIFLGYSYWVYLEPAAFSPRCLFVSALGNWKDRTFHVRMCMYMYLLYTICVQCMYV